MVSVVRVRGQDETTLLEPTDPVGDTLGMRPLVEEVRAQSTDGKREQEPVDEHGCGARHVGTARTQSQKQWGNDDDLVSCPVNTWT